MSWKYYLVMVIPSPDRHPPDMSNSTMSRNDRLSRRALRAPAAVAGVAVITLSLLLSVAPAMGAANNSHAGGNGTSGNLKVHDAGTGEETVGTDNEPHVCAFWLGFTFDAPFEAGTWELVSWAPTGDGSTIDSGVYDTAGDGTDSSSVLNLPAGHYRVEWAATGASASKKKTFWVDAECGEDQSQAEEPGSPTEESQAEEPASPAEESQVEESQAEEPASPAEESQVEESQAEDPPTEEATTSSDESAPEEPPSPDDESTTEEQASDPADQSVTDDSTSEEQPSDPADESVTDDSTSEEQPSDPADQSVADDSTSEDPAPADDESVAEDPETPGDSEDGDDQVEAQEPGSADHGTPPAQDVLERAADDNPTMSDTAIPTRSASGGLVATMMLLALIVVHGTTRRPRSLDRDMTNEDV